MDKGGSFTGSVGPKQRLLWIKKRSWNLWRLDEDTALVMRTTGGYGREEPSGIQRAGKEWWRLQAGPRTPRTSMPHKGKNKAAKRSGALA